ncbi:bifunctional 4-hydroxy-2-oxoglutarate aldolase/2-dehydro-3-deoxy-phosphogluconate aldolase [Mycolicibacterium sp. YH-1]|uniref:bifunctional 4-hydroxy-2-oxoglutarate aldolase/2-dehydro-3-deoxy-phosphogluconate aldolase n=1 Tax=Mycolicibacterium sp. YH-1 TaxID=2908837 RepID=UPI001F4C410C|nr:bifunctional 4-hydroxy-2-oxoglutarate aldolase/2-dehydro-3-deoxy-phosphogluconate aldolase [Mycolicibacterium sp. YH-1]UNB54451.1 bifunctional 4-hydroxy-2-oxoglutarate aldolase/2-dehydro-3-deoxy-phosphogluconate aldolase [Mycolicibacterium sp. YH-1]
MTTTPLTDPAPGGLSIALAGVPVVAILRASSGERLPEVCKVLYASGVRVLEFTLTTDSALGALTRTRDLLPADAVLGVGSVRTNEQVAVCADAGAEFLVSPVNTPALVEEARRRQLPYLAGALSPSEIHSAWADGAAAVKLFPAGPVGGPAYLRAVRGPLPNIPLVPTGGIDIEEVGTYLMAGATAVGLGGALQGDAANPGGDLDALAERARRAVASAQVGS